MQALNSFSHLPRRVAAAMLAVVALGVLPGSLSARATPVAPLVLSQTLHTGGEPFGIAIDAGRGRAYVSDSRENTLYVFDLATGEPVAHIATGRQPGQVVLVGSRIFVSNFTDVSITVIDASTQRVVKTLAFGGLGLAVNHQTGRLYAAAGSRISVLDATSDALITTIAAPEGANVWGVAVDAAANRVYATDIASPRVLVYDGATNQLVGEIAIDAPGRLGITVGAAGRVFVASYTDASPRLFVIDGARVVDRLPIAAFTSSLAAHPTSGLVYAASGADRSVTELDTQRPGVVSKASLAESAAAVAINPESGEPVVATARRAALPARPSVDVSPTARP
jgi:DNA-binding beta-propeller fold protein YncE